MARVNIPAHILNKQAEIDYQNARGTAHLNMLLDTHGRYTLVFNNNLRELEILKREYNSLISKKENELLTALSRHIINNELTEVRGIGTRLKDTILSKVFKTRLDDLSSFDTLIDINETIQNSIWHWVKKKKLEINTRMKRIFPNKQLILNKYQAEEEKIKINIEKLDKFLIKIGIILDQLQVYIGDLQEISEDYFFQMLKTPNFIEVNKINSYIKGIFSEWEQPPLWFQKLVMDKNSIYTDIVFD